MRRTSLVMFSVGSLLVGLALGTSLGFRHSGSTVHAELPDKHTVERVYRELSQEGSVIQECSALLSKIAAVTTPSVVHIQSERRIPGRGKEEETGSGVIMTSAKHSGQYVVTNGHVIDKTALESISIHLYDGRVIQPERVWVDSKTDVAVMRINAGNLPPARWGDSQKLEIGHMVLAMGSPFGLSRSVTLGIISAKGRRKLSLGQSDVINQDFLQTDAAINPGNSGGPLIDLQGRVVGINTAIASSSGGNEGIGFSIPSHLAQRVMEQLLDHGVVHRSFIGVKLDDKFDAKAVNRLKLDRIRGTRVAEVFPNSPASKSGLQFDDVVLSFDGTEVQDHDHLINLVSLSPIGKRIQMVIWRGGRSVNLTIILADRNELPDQSSVPAPTDPIRPVKQMSWVVKPLGLSIHAVDEGLAKQIDLPADTRGVLVLNVDRKSPLFGRFQPYDIIETVAGTATNDVAEFELALEAASKHESVIFKIRRPEKDGPKTRLFVWEK